MTRSIGLRLLSVLAASMAVACTSVTPTPVPRTASPVPDASLLVATPAVMSASPGSLSPPGQDVAFAVSGSGFVECGDDIHICQAWFAMRPWHGDVGPAQWYVPTAVAREFPVEPTGLGTSIVSGSPGGLPDAIPSGEYQLAGAHGVASDMPTPGAPNVTSVSLLCTEVIRVEPGTTDLGVAVAFDTGGCAMAIAATPVAVADVPTTVPLTVVGSGEVACGDELHPCTALLVVEPVDVQGSLDLDDVVRYPDDAFDHHPGEREGVSRVSGRPPGLPARLEVGTHYLVTGVIAVLSDVNDVDQETGETFFEFVTMEVGCSDRLTPGPTTLDLTIDVRFNGDGCILQTSSTPV